MKDNYTVFIFTGAMEHGRKYFSIFRAVDNMSYLTHSVRDFFNKKNHIFDSKEITIEEARKMVENGKVFFPISSTVDVSEIENYWNVGLFPVLMYAKDYNRFKKDYALEA